MIPFEPILEDLSFDYVIKNKEYFINAARSKAWGGDVFFFPPNRALKDRGCAIYHYFCGRPFVEDTDPYWNKTDANDEKPHYSNCTGVQGAFYYKRTGIILDCLLGDAIKAYEKYEGRKDGGNFNGQYIGDTIQQGDMIIFADVDDNGKPTMNGCGHILSDELEENGLFHIMEGAYSRKTIYKGKACLTYTLKKSDMITGKVITVRPQSPYKLAVFAVIHTGDVFEKWVMPTPVQKDNNVDQIYIGIDDLRARHKPTTNSQSHGYMSMGYYNVIDFEEKPDYTWYHIGSNCYVAKVDKVVYYPKSKEKDYKALYEECLSKMSEARNDLDGVKNKLK